MTSVEIICPSSRAENIPRVIEMYKEQDYPREFLSLAILSDGQGFTLYTEPGDKIWHWGIDRASIGAKRNDLCKYSKSDIIIHFDDDDYYAPDWVSCSVASLANNDITGLRKGYFYNVHTKVGKYYEAFTPQPYIMGATMCYRRSMWEQNHFNEQVPYGEDAMFMGYAGKVKNHDYIDGFTAIIHGNNTQSHQAFQAMRVVDRNKIPYVQRYK